MNRRATPLEWTDEQLAGFWDYYAEQRQEEFFTRLFGDRVLELTRRFYGADAVLCDYGCGSGFLLEKLLATHRAAACDFSKANLDEVRRRLVRAATELEVAQLLEVRTTWMESIGDVPVAEGPMSKLFSTEAIVRGAEDLTALVGPDALRRRGDPTALQDGHIEHGLRFSLGTTIYAGTSEVQRNIIAQRRCGLPRP